MQHGEVKEGEVADPHHAVNVDKLETLVHKVADITQVDQQVGTGSTATSLVALEDQHQHVGTDETQHYQEDGQVGLQEGRGVFDGRESSSAGSGGG